MSGKIDILKKRQGKLKQFNSADLIQLKVGRNIWGHCDVLNEEETFVEKCIRLMNNRNKVWKNLFLSVKSQGMLKKGCLCLP